MKGADHENPAVQAFGRWRFDAGTGDLFDGTTTTRLEPQVARLLDYLLSHQDTLIGRDELMAAVWDDRIVSDDAINRCISILRHKLTPDDRNAYIETVIRRGFISHFPPPLQEPAPAEDTAPLTDTPPLEAMPPPRETAPVEQGPARPKRWQLGALAAVAALVIFGALRMLGDAEPPVPAAEAGGPPMVAVLPFISSGLPGDSEFFAGGVHDDLLTQLAQLDSLRVISRTSVAEYRDAERNIREIGRELGADAILEGGVQRVGDQIRINVQLIDARSDVHLWAEQYDRELTPTNIFAIQAEIAHSVASALDSTLTAGEARQLNVLPTENMAAYRAYHEAMELREISAISTPAYIAALERAVALDPEFVRAWAELAGALSFANIRERDPEKLLRLEEILERIRALAPQSSEYLIAQAYYTYYILKDYDRAYALISQARLLRPSDIQLLELQTWIQRRQGDYPGKIATIRQARNLDPRSFYWTLRLATNLLLAHRYDEAGVVIEQAPAEDLRLGVLRSTLRVREHREPARMLDEILALQREYGESAVPLGLWEAHIAARDYAGAMAVLDAFETAETAGARWAFISLPDPVLARAITLQLQDAGDPPNPVLAEARARVARAREAGFYITPSNAYLATALATAAGGDTGRTERLVRTWLREAARDVPQLVNHRHYACRALGMAAAVSAAVKCLRESLVEPSPVMPFLEPLLPYYDSMREDPRFMGFLAEIEGS